MVVGTDYKVHKSIQESLEMLAGKELTKEEIIGAEGFRLSLYLKMNSIEDFHKLRRNADEKEQQLRDGIQS